ncbi:hypothetical protein ACTXJY_13795, partial [Corynebacterium casei]|uniref:hypothetical protein n=1 Tax=Corynebacterium casei TaxID=160386 RepID=UPI003FD5174E
ITLELFGIGLAWHSEEITFQSHVDGILGVYQTGVSASHEVGKIHYINIAWTFRLRRVKGRLNLSVQRDIMRASL